MKILLALSCFLIPFLALADSFEGKVVAVTDGDTIKVLRPNNTLEKIRLLGIDAPEKKQDFGQKSKTTLSEKIAGKQVKVEFSKRDRYGRLLGKIISGAEDVNLSQIKTGMAWHYKQYAKEQTQSDALAYAEAQSLAKLQTAGLWAGNQPVPPWDFRRSNRIVASKKPKRAKTHRHKHVHFAW